LSLCWSRAVLSWSFSLLALSVCGCATPQEVTQTAVPPPQLALDEIPLQITQRCPGDPACPDEGDGRLYAGFAKRDVTPQIEPFTDTNGNGVYDDGEPYEDKNKNGTFDAYWIAGYDSGRLATGVNDPVWARALALRQNQTTVVVVAVDTLGLFRDEFDYVNKLIDKRLGIDLLLLHGTHVHETADLTGGWGPDDFTNGVNNAYRQKVHQAIADAATEAVANLRPARMTLGSIKVQDPDGNMKRYVFDSRDPVVINNVLHTMQFLDVSTTPPQPITTLVNWSNHPEAAGSKNKLISSDFVHYLRQELEQKGAGPVVYVSGSIGGLLGPGHAAPLDETGTPVTEEGLKKAQALGHEVARFALTAMADPGNLSVEGKAARLSFRSTEFKTHIENQKYHLAAMLGVFKRKFCCFDDTRPLSEENIPSVETLVAYLRIGPASIITNPGELTSELFLGGYDGSLAGTYPLFDPRKANAPDLSLAPLPPYLIDRMHGVREHRMTWGLTGDFLGYILPRYHFVLSEKRPYIDQAKGDHYEETNSIGPRAEAEIVGTMRQLVESARE
jgi:hypothetical protein